MKQYKLDFRHVQFIPFKIEFESMQLEECQCWGVDARNAQQPWECTTALGKHQSFGSVHTRQVSKH